MARSNVATQNGQLDTGLTEELQQDKVAVVGQMTLAVAHELSNPLAAIVASAQTMLAFWPRQNTQATVSEIEAASNAHLDPAAAIQFREDIELILSEARRAGEIVGGLLAFARQQRPERCAVSLHEVIQRVALLGNNLLQTHNITLQLPTFSEEKNDLWVEADSNQLQQVLLNLLVNAQQAICGIKKNGKVEIAVHRVSGPMAEVHVEDDGPGIPDTQRAAVLQPFFTTKPAGEGTGLGLPICVDILRALGGSLRIEDTESGMGTRFVISLPLTERVEENTPDASIALPFAKPAEETLPVGADDQPSRVLLVDDEAAILRSVGRYLAGAGYDVTTAHTGKDALCRMRADHFDAVVCDLRMPELSGEELYKLAKDECPDLVPRMIFTSGDLLRQESREFVNESGCHSLQKPYELTDLLDILVEVCLQENHLRTR